MVLDLYARVLEGSAPGDAATRSSRPIEKTPIQARRHGRVAPGSGQAGRVESYDERLPLSLIVLAVTTGPEAKVEKRRTNRAGWSCESPAGPVIQVS